MRVIYGLIIILVLFCGSFAHALERFDIITTEELEQMLKARESKKADFVLVNTLDELIYLNSTIPGSINVPWSRVKETIHRAGNDKNKLLVMY